MRPEVKELCRKEFDVLVVGGGIFGACAAWDATLRGLSVALVEKSDFCSGVSANSYKMVHKGGLAKSSGLSNGGFSFRVTM
jgi:glycerol-3-phosphate dehydrogenase